MTPPTWPLQQHFFVMFSNPQETPQPVKLRSSCDECGVGKVKCDRKHPKCGRCVANGAVCVYGVSRKIGKPPRKRVRSRGGNDDDDVRNSTGMRSSMNAANSLVSCSWGASDGFPNPMDNFWDPMKDNSHDYNTHNCIHNQDRNSEMNEDSQNKSNTLFDLDGFLSDSYSNILGSSMPNFTSLGFDGWKDKVQYSTLPFPPVEAPTKHILPCESTMESQSGWTQSEAEGNSPSSMKGHDCYREAHDLLRRSSTATGNGTDLMAWDHLLLLNREASEQLYRLLRCACSASPYLVMLYATLISAILTRYQHAIDDTLCAPSNPPSPESTPGTSDADGSAIRTVPLVRPAVAPAKIVIGTFSVDDHRLQCALKIQLLASEVRRSAQLMNQFAAYNFDNRKSGDFSGNDINGLHQSLNSWLQGEYSKISHMISTRLMELST